VTLPLDQGQFLAMFAAENARIWPARLLGYLVGFAILGALFARYPVGERLALAGLAVFWAWNAIVAQFIYFTPINPAAHGLAAMSLVQSFAFAAAARAPAQRAVTVTGRARARPAVTVRA